VTFVLEDVVAKPFSERSVGNNCVEVHFSTFSGSMEYLSIALIPFFYSRVKSRNSSTTKKNHESQIIEDDWNYKMKNRLSTYNPSLTGPIPETLSSLLVYIPRR
jgi:hypothetical protein